VRRISTVASGAGFSPVGALVGSVVAGTIAACAPLTGARPLERGMHEVGASVGGPFVRVGDTPLPLPNIVVQGRSGVAEPVDRPLDLNYGLNVTATAFGLLQGHVGADWLLSEQDGAIPALATTHRVFFGTNLLGLANKPRLEGWGAYQLEFNLSWLMKAQLLYLGLSQYVDFGNPHVTLTPAIGAVLDPSPKRSGGSRIHLELRWYAPNLNKTLNTVVWVPENAGALGVMAGYSFVLDGKRRAERARARRSRAEESKP
jgi:hypothetical protein